MRLLKNTGYSLIFFCAVGLAASCADAPRPPSAQTTSSKLHLGQLEDSVQDGDLVLRLGSDEMSHLFARLNAKDQRYSHCGIAIREQGVVYVYHMATRSLQCTEGMLHERLATFVDEHHNASIALMRYDLPDSTRLQLCKYIKRQYALAPRFDTQFDLATDTALYCTELIYKALLQCTKDSNYLQKSHSVTHKTYIALDDLFLNKHCKTICEISY